MMSNLIPKVFSKGKTIKYNLRFWFELKTFEIEYVWHWIMSILKGPIFLITLKQTW